MVHLLLTWVNRGDTVPYKNRSLMKVNPFTRILLLWGLLIGPSAFAQTSFDGLVFSCNASAQEKLPAEMNRYLRELRIDPRQVSQSNTPDGGVAYTLKTTGTSTLALSRHAPFHLRNEIVVIRGPKNKPKKVSTVSKKEILLSLLHPGRTTHFKGDACSIHALREHVGVRQNVVAWVEKIEWIWPDGGAACWDTSKWKNGTPSNLAKIDDALLDAFINPKNYAIGCYAASKLSYAHGVLDYYQRVRNAPEKAQLIRLRLLYDQDPLLNIEPSETWDFEPNYDPTQRPIPGKLLAIQRGVAPKHFVPGDWVYFLNSDPVTYADTGYEGSNAIYLGRGKFDDFYNDHHNAYTFKEKINEVYQWRHGVFNHIRDAQKVRTLSPSDYERLCQPPAQGGLLLDLRLTPYLFGYENLPLFPE